MQTPIQTQMDGKTIAIFPGGEAGVPIVYASLYAPVERAVLAQCRALGCPPFHLVSVTGLRWDEELSPWANGPVVSPEDHFTGEAGQYARWMEQTLIPFAEKTLAPARRVIAGYSMGGLFALYAPYVTGAFSAAVSASGSVWYPGFVEYAGAHDFLKKPGAVYLSLGDRESRTKNPALRQTEIRTQQLLALYQSKGVDAVFELNPGNHYKAPAYRLAKGIAWALKRAGAQP